MPLPNYYPVASFRISQAVKTAMAGDRFVQTWVLLHAVLMEKELSGGRTDKSYFKNMFV